jgi:hypothetical protein
VAHGRGPRESAPCAFSLRAMNESRTDSDSEMSKPDL